LFKRHLNLVSLLFMSYFTFHLIVHGVANQIIAERFSIFLSKINYLLTTIFFIRLAIFQRNSIHRYPAFLSNIFISLLPVSLLFELTITFCLNLFIVYVVDKLTNRNFLEVCQIELRSCSNIELCFQLIIFPNKIKHLAFTNGLIFRHYFTFKNLLNIITDLLPFYLFTKALPDNLNWLLYVTETGHLSLATIFFIGLLKFRL